MAQQNSSELIVLEDNQTVAELLKKEGYYFPMASHHVSEQKVWNFFMSIFDNNEFASAGACGNMQHESGLYSDNAENSWNTMTGHSDEWLTQNINNGTIDLAEFLQRSWWVNNYGFGYGLSQWTDTTRRTLLWNRTINIGLDIDNEDAQLNYIRWEFTDPSSYYEQFRQGMIDCTSVEQATRYYCANYEVGAWSTSRLTFANYFYNTYGSGTQQNNINVTTIGNGTAYVSNSHPQDGQSFTLYANAGAGDALIDITARDSHGYSIAMVVSPSYTYTYDETNWGNYIDITVEFSGTPPIPPTPTYKDEHHMPIWMYPFMRC